MKKIFSAGLSLAVVVAVCAAVLAVTDRVVRRQVATRQARAAVHAARAVMPGAVKKVIPQTHAAGVYYIGCDAAGCAVAYACAGRSTQGYGGPLELMIGFLPDYTIVTYRVLDASETPGFGGRLTERAFLRQFKGLSAAREIAVRQDGGAIEALTSATITSRAVCDAINIARARLAAARAR